MSELDPDHIAKVAWHAVSAGDALERLASDEQGLDGPADLHQYSRASSRRRRP